MSLSNLATLATLIFLTSSPQTLADEAKPKKNLNLNPVTKSGTKADPKEVRRLPVAQKVCDVSGTQFVVRDNIDEARCLDVSGKLTQTFDSTKKLQEMKAVPTLTPPKRDAPEPTRNYDPLRQNP